MLVLKKNPVGIDSIIDRLQKKTEAYFLAEGWADYTSYHRAYKNPNEGDVIPEIYIGSGEYLEVLFDDTQNATSFFLAEDTRTQDDEFIISQGLSFIFQVQLNKLYPQITHRADEELHAHILTAIKKAGFEKNVEGITTGAENVYSELSISGDLQELIKLDDLSYFHVVKIDMEVNYQFDNCGTKIH